MTSLERMLAALRFEKPDRVPVFLNNTLPVTCLTKSSVRDINLNEDNFVEALLAGYHYYGYDGVRVGIDVTIEAEAMGCKLNFPEDDFASVREFVLKDPDNLDKLKVPDPQSDGRMPMIVNATSRIAKEVGDKAFVGSLIMGPGVLASQLMGAHDFLIMCLTEPEYIEKLLDFCSEVTIRFGTAVTKAGAHGVVIGEAMCSPQMLGPVLYKELVLGRHKRIIEELKRNGAENQIFHICGNVESILEDVANTGATGLDVDTPLDIVKGRSMLGKRLAFTGNVSPALLLNGSVEEVLEACAGTLAIKDELGLVLNAGCCMARLTPPENIKAMVEAASTIGCY